MTTPLSFSFKASYGIGQLSTGAVNMMTRICLFFFYSQVLGLSPFLAGIATASATVFDAITDPIIGSLSDNWRSKYGRRFPFMLTGTLPAAICVFLLFTPLVEGEQLLFVWLIVFACLTNFFTTLFIIPHYALGAELSEDYKERASIVTFRNFFHFSGYLLVMFLAFGYFFAPSQEFSNGQLNQAVYSPFALLVAVIYTLFTCLSLWQTKSIIPALKAAPDKQENHGLSSLKTIFTDVFEALSNDSYRKLLLGNLFLLIGTGLMFTLELYALTFFWGLSGEYSLMLVGLAFYPGAYIGIALTQYLISKLGKMNVMTWGVVFWILFVIIPILLRLAGYFPANDSYLLVPVLLAFRVLQGMASVPVDNAYGSAMADAADAQELKSNKRQEGVFFAAAYFSMKASYGIGSAVAGLALWFIGWPTDSEAINASHIYSLGMILGPVVACFGLVSAYFYNQYDLSEERHAEILAELKLRRAG